MVCVINIVCSGYCYSSLGETSLQPEQQARSLDLPSGVAINSSCHGEYLPINSCMDLFRVVFLLIESSVDEICHLVVTNKAVLLYFLNTS